MADLEIIAGLDVANSVKPIEKDVSEKLNPLLKTDENARVKLVAELDPTESIKVISSQLDTLNKGLALNINTVNVANIDSRQLQDNINQATANANTTITLTPVVNKSKMSEVTKYIDEVTKMFSDSKLAGSINADSIINGLKERFNIAGKEIKESVYKYVNNLKIDPQNQQIITQSYQELINNINKAFDSSKLNNNSNLNKNLSDEINKISDTFADVEEKSKQSTQAMTQGLNQTGQAAEKARESIEKISSNTTRGGYVYETKDLLNNIKQFDLESNAIAELSQQFKNIQGVVEVTTKEIANSNGTVTSFTTSVKSASGATEQFKYSLKEVKSEDGSGGFQYVLQNVTAADAGIQRLIESNDKWENRVKAAVTNVTSNLKKVQSAYQDQNSNNSVKNYESYDELTKRVKAANVAISELGKSTQSNFSANKASVDAAISEVEMYAKSLHNAQSMATSLRNKDPQVVKEETISKLERFIQVIKNSKVPLESMQKEIDNLKSSISTINSIDSKDVSLKGNLTNALDQIAIVKARLDSLKELAKGFKSVDSDITKGINALQSMTNATVLKKNGNDENVKKQIAEINELIEKYKSLKSAISDSKNFTPESLENARIQLKEYGNQIDQIRDNIVQLRNSFQNTNGTNTIDSQAKAMERQAKAIQTYTSQIQNDINKLNKMSVNTIFSTNANNSQAQAQKSAIQDLIKEYEKLKATMSSNMSTSDLEKAKIRLAELREQLKGAETGMTTLRASMQNDKGTQKLAADISLLTAQIKQFRNANSKSEAKFGSEYDSLLQKLKQNPDVSGLYAIRQQFRQLQGDVRAAGLTGTTFFDKLKADAAKFSAWFGVAAPGMLIAREIRQMFSDVVELDTAIVDLEKTFQGTSQDLQDFYYESNNIARQLGVTTQEVITQAGAWSRLGWVS